MRLAFLARFSPLYDQLDGGAGGGAPLGGDPAPAAAGTPSPAPGGVGTGTVTPDPNGTPAQRFAYAEDRSNWIPPHRWNQAGERYRALVEERDRLMQGMTNMNQRVRALMGVAEPEDPRAAQIKEQMTKLFPGLAKFIENPQLVDTLMQGGGQRGDSAFETAYWDRHSSEVVSDALTQYAKAANIDPSRLGATATSQMARQISSFIAADPTGQRLAAYERKDPRFTQELIADLTGFFVAPLRQTTNVQNAQQVEQARRLPSMRGPSGPPPSAAGGHARLKGKQLHEAARQAILAAG